MTPEEYFAGSPHGWAVFGRVRSALAALHGLEVRPSTSQVAFRQRRTFAWLWRPGQYLANPGAEVVLSIALGRHDASPRFKEVAHPSPLHWIHHLEIQDVEEVDPEVVAWLREAAERST
jgi:hypothetical protein